MFYVRVQGGKETSSAKGKAEMKQGKNVGKEKGTNTDSRKNGTRRFPHLRQAYFDLSPYTRLGRGKL